MRACVAGQELHAPPLLDFEVVSALRSLTLTDRISLARAHDALSDCEDLPIHCWHADDALGVSVDRAPLTTA